MGFADDRLAGAGPEATVRAVAARLRAEAVAATGREAAADVVAELARRARLRVVDCDAASMGGRDGRLRPGHQILVSARLEPASRAWTVAHELGHQHLHDDPDLEDRELVPLGRCEAARSGDVPVDGYSPEEFRETHANVFADELLCPSATLGARLAAGATTFTVAASLGVAPEVVRRQAVHALLLPLAGPREWSRQAADRPQDTCVDWVGGPLLAVGGPGTGKTATVLARARRILAEPDAKPSSLLVVAPTARAADALREALAVDDERVATHSLVTSFQDLSFEIVSRWADRVGRGGTPKVLDRVTLARVVAEALEAGGPAKAGRGDVRAAVRRMVSQAGGIAGAPPEAPDPTLVEARRLLERHNLADAPGLPSLAVEILRAAPEVREHLRGRFRHVLVDDIQHAPPTGVGLLRRLSPDTADVFATGDPSQAVDRHRSSEPCAVRQFERLFAPRRMDLARDYRSQPALSRARRAVAWARPATDAAPDPAQGWATATVLPDEASEAEAVAARVNALARAGTPWRDQVVLAWSRTTLRLVHAALVRTGAPVAYIHDLASRPEVRAVLDFLALAVDREARRLPAVAGLRRYEVDRTVAAAVAAEVGPSPRSMTAALMAASRRWRPVDARSADGLAQLARDVALLRSGTMWGGLVDWLHPSTGLPPFDIHRGTDAAARTRLFSLHQLLKACAEHVALGGRDARGLEERVAVVNATDQRTHYRRVTLDALGLNAVRLVTARESAGLEWPVVHVAGLWRAPTRHGSEASDEERAVLRLALSRARVATHLTRPAERRGRRVDGLSIPGGADLTA